MKVKSITNMQDLNIFAIPTKSPTNIQSSIPVKTLTYKKSHVLPYRRSWDSEGNYQTPEYNLSEICAAEDADGIIRRTIQKKRALADKEGWTLTGNNNKTIAYIEQRLKEISLSQNYPMQLLIKDSVGDLVRFHNCFWKKARDKRSSSGKRRLVRTYNGEKEMEPVAAYFRIPAETVSILTDKYGNPKWYMQQMPDGRYEEYPANDVIHFKFNRRAGFNFAAPGLLPAVDDIRSLRRIEESVELLVDQHLFPLFTLTIGSEEWPVEQYPDGTSEIDLWANKINNMPSSGGIIVTHRHKFDILEAKDVVPVEEYLDYFKKRAFTSAGVSAIDMGEGDGMNRSTADNASKILINDVKDYQKEFEYQFEFEVIYELLLERYNPTCLMEENVVHLQFNEIDIESMIKLENHSALMYNMNYLSEDESRLRAKFKKLDKEEDQQKMYLHKVEKPKIDWTAKAKLGMSTGSSTKNATNRSTPTNQHGTKSAPTGRKSSMDIEQLFLSSIIDDFDIKDSDLTKIQVKNWLFSIDLEDNNSDISNNLFFYIDTIVDHGTEMLENKEVSTEDVKDFVKRNILKLIEKEDIDA